MVPGNSLGVWLPVLAGADVYIGCCSVLVFREKRLAAVSRKSPALENGISGRDCFGNVCVAMRSGNKTGFESRWRKILARRQHGMEETVERVLITLHDFGVALRAA